MSPFNAKVINYTKIQLASRSVLVSEERQIQVTPMLAYMKTEQLGEVGLLHKNFKNEESKRFINGSLPQNKVFYFSKELYLFKGTFFS